MNFTRQIINPTWIFFAFVCFLMFGATTIFFTFFRLPVLVMILSGGLCFMTMLFTLTIGLYVHWKSASKRQNRRYDETTYLQIDGDIEIGLPGDIPLIPPTPKRILNTLISLAPKRKSSSPIPTPKLKPCRNHPSLQNSYLFDKFMSAFFSWGQKSFNSRRHAVSESNTVDYVDKVFPNSKKARTYTKSESAIIDMEDCLEGIEIAKNVEFSEDIFEIEMDFDNNYVYKEMKIE